ncbi:MAG TPA: PAS domain-containing protein [Candidatus Cloacimonetes bacterium]|nr:PAS domain-containing protein [Candidatus Cloacimonadota bacterium]HEX37793.1 PAS domain-containing protein [Candidatus Cloacimonadota bacterium]
MHLTFQDKLRIIVIILLAILIINACFILYKINSNMIPDFIQERIATVQYIFLFIEIILGIMLLFYVPMILHQSLKPIESVFEELRRGKYDISIPEEYHRGPVAKLITSTNIMINNLKLFDKEKKGKILEYVQRINFIMEQTDDGILITNEKDKIVMINKHAQNLLGVVSAEDQPPLLDFHYEAEVKKFFQEASSQRILISERKIYIQKIKKHVSFHVGIIHDDKGEVRGMVFVLTGIDLKKLYELPRSEDGKRKSEG